MKGVVVLLATMALIAAGCGSDGGAVVDDGDGAQVYEIACIACHDAGGEGIEGLGKPLARSDFITSRSDQELLEFIVIGRGTGDPDNTSGVAMPPRGGRPDLTDEEILDVIAYLRTLQGG